MWGESQSTLAVIREEIENIGMGGGGVNSNLNNCLPRNCVRKTEAYITCVGLSKVKSAQLNGLEGWWVGGV